ncbi:Internal alternative NAD(P)H-ubiquinone oxidoreductase A1, mitochondrial [Seminavis robusta]|uniref:Internal alternative NAD(P)H-ubiquinone oxidoreductase A1, mitochondrial n=1 Tax=Seminavis robusta TaxID=568900 RepID=A0A9N8E1H7_9STRA|nr:Internal alternative NAD(P)H-ubiquinone oxidoreductase A1, mitochondrial [Seminavis robusta]|eukprot:Sro556_g166030.1 Internal alternative NAD(P)H-ubiquinone oxidoreductase A1, mitochondrial (699) ;mRNA; r:51606-53702
MNITGKLITVALATLTMLTRDGLTTNAFSPTALMVRKMVSMGQNPTSFAAITRLYSTTEDSKTTSSTDNHDDGDNDDEKSEEDYIRKLFEENTPPELDVVNDNNNEGMDDLVSLSDLVMLGANRSLMEQDPVMRQVTSELRVWKNFRQAEALAKPGIPLDVLLERTWDTAEDAFVHLRRLAYEKGAAVLTPEEDVTRKTIVILGSGWAAHALMKVADNQKLRIIVVSPSNHFVFTPMLASASVGTVEYRSMTEAVRAANPMIHEYIEGKATDINVNNKTVTVKLNPLLTTTTDDNQESPTIQLSYDHIVVSVGSKVNDGIVPGARKYALGLKTTDDARKLRTAVGECFEYASRPDISSGNDPGTLAERTRRVTFLIAGGGPTGVELAGELCDLFQDITREHKGTYPKLANHTRVVLAHGGPDLVPQFEDPLPAQALASLRAKGVEVYLNTRVQQVTEKSATLSVKQFDQDGKLTAEREEIEVPIGLTVWCAGTAPVGFCETLLKQLPPEARNPDGRIKVDRWMRPAMKDPSLLGSVLVLGDAAAQEMSDDWQSPDGQSRLLPSTAQVAGQQGAFVARNLCRNYNLTATPPHVVFPADSNSSTNVFYDPVLNSWLQFRGIENSPPFTFLNLGLLAYLGGGEALSQVQVGEVSVVSKAGSIGFLLWRSVYLVKQVATRNRVLVTFDWIKSSVFGRDITRL